MEGSEFHKTYPEFKLEENAFDYALVSLLNPAEILIAGLEEGIPGSENFVGLLKMTKNQKHALF